jgi:hypothetical protein
VQDVKRYRRRRNRGAALLRPPPQVARADGRRRNRKPARLRAARIAAVRRQPARRREATAKALREVKRLLASISRSPAPLVWRTFSVRQASVLAADYRTHPLPDRATAEYRDRWFADSPLEGGVYCELVSEVGFPGLVEKAGFQGIMDDNGSVETLFWARIRWNFVFGLGSFLPLFPS